MVESFEDGFTGRKISGFYANFYHYTKQKESQFISALLISYPADL